MRLGLSVEEIRKQLGGSVVGRQLYLFGELPSNDTLRQLARQGAVDGAVVLADSQTAGRGRPGQAWLSPPGSNLYVSVLFRPGFHPREAMRFSFIASLALGDTLAALALRSAIKWPNDVLVKGRKVAGAHGRTGFARLFLGSVAERVVATSPCPVMTVRGK